MNIAIKTIDDSRWQHWLTVAIVVGLILVGAIVGFSLALQLIGSLEVTPII